MLWKKTDRSVSHMERTMEIRWSVERGVPKRIAIFVDEEEKRKVGLAIVSVRDLESIGRDEKFFEKLREMEIKGATRYALWSLSRQALHSKKLEKALRRHFVEPIVIVTVMNYCREKGLLDDEEWTRNTVRKWHAQGKSKADVRARLRKEGVESGDVIYDDISSLDRLVTRKYPQLLEVKTPYKERMRALQALQRRGFSYTIVQEFLQKKKMNTMMGEEESI